MGIFDIFRSRRFKRKDSNAGEAGQALEELRSSLYNDLRTSEGAKCQQQRLCGPVVAMSFNFVVAISIIMINKLVLNNTGFKYPIYLTLIHYVTAWILLAILKAFSLLPVSPPNKTTPFAPLFSLGVVMAFASGLSNASLSLNSVGFYQMAKIVVTPTVVVAEFVLYRKSISYKKAWTLVVVSVGVGVATVSDVKFSSMGAFIAIAWVVPSAINKILWTNLQQHGNWTALALMWKTTPITILFLIALMQWLDPPEALTFKWDLHNSTAVILSAILGFLLQLSGALALGATSATSHVVLGQFKTCVLILGGYVLFDENPGFASLVGSTIALLGMSIYTSVSMKESQEQQSNQHLKKPLPLSKPKTELDEAYSRDTSSDISANTA